MLLCVTSGTLTLRAYSMLWSVDIAMLGQEAAATETEIDTDTVHRSGQQLDAL
jgi:hypothetical protein